MKLTPHQYQRTAADFMISNPRGAVLLDTGLGKTCVSLSVLRALGAIDQGQPALVIGPLRVIQSTWKDEAAKFDQFKHFRFVVLHGSKKDERLEEPADIYLINPEGLLWLKHKKNLPAWKTLIVDESTKFKNPKSARSRVLQKMRNQFSRRYILSATPAPNAARNVDQIFAQWSLLDDRLGKNVTAFRREFCYRGGFDNREWLPRDGALEQIAKRVEPITLHQSKFDHLEMPSLVVNDIKLKLGPKCQKVYKKFERELFAELPDESRLLAFSASEKYTKARQLANGTAYIDGETTWFHDVKTDALEELVESLQGRPLLTLYQYNADLDAIQNRLGELPAINGKTSEKETARILKAWNRGEIPHLLGQPSAMSHGLNMQAGGSNVCWYSLCNCQETYSQAIDRLHRQGQTETVKVHRLLMAGTIDTTIARQLEKKKIKQADFLAKVQGRPA